MPQGEVAGQWGPSGRPIMVIKVWSVDHHCVCWSTQAFLVVCSVKHFEECNGASEIGK